MAVLNLDEEILTTEELIVNTAPKYVTNEKLQTSTIFNKDQDIDNITQYISGSKWEVDYFLQVRDINDQPLMPDINVPNTTLKYNRINNLIIFLQNPIDQSNVNDITGSGIINVGTVPSYGDVIKATLLGGREALFVITSVTKNTYNTKSVFLLEFKLYSFLDIDTVTYNDIVYKTIKEFYYDKNYILDNSTPILYAAEYKKKLDLKKEPKKILNIYMNRFFYHEQSLIKLDTEVSDYVDIFLVDFLFKLVNSTDHEDLLKVNRLEYNNPKIKNTVWDAIIERDIDMLELADRDIGFRYVPSTRSNPHARHISYLNINFIVDKLFGADAAGYTIIENPLMKTTVTAPIGIDKNTYVFSDSFYIQDRDNCGIVEKALLDYLNGKIIDDNLLDVILPEYKYWTTIDQYYLLPILLLLIHDKIKYSYSEI